MFIRKLTIKRIPVSGKLFFSNAVNKSETTSCNVSTQHINESKLLQVETADLKIKGFFLIDDSVYIKTSSTMKKSIKSIMTGNNLL